ncbi:MAG: class I SAM-dependent methyltransferase [Acidimicrobiia bacterium]|nr:class I SAM-dependent methyltransferase [Acidimicrobiia bacterium]
MPSLMDRLNDEYRAHVDRLLAEHDRDTAMALAVGAHWEAVGAVEEGVLRLAGLTPDTDLLDVGCGSGRLAARLGARHRGRYLGLDVVPAVIEYAREQHPDFEFAVTDGLSVPAPDDSFDLACFFSVLTHLPHEAGYRLLQEAARVLRPGGGCVVSFLELAEPNHWPIFEATAASIGVARHHNQFTHRDDLALLAERAGFAVERVVGGWEHVVPIDGTYTRDDGEVVTSPARLGQSWMILRRPAD